jgi:hypothetical protein
MLVSQHIMYTHVHAAVACLLLQSKQLLFYHIRTLLIHCVHLPYIYMHAHIPATTTGVIAILNEECVVPKGSDEKLASKLASIHEDHPNFRKNKLGG